MTVTRRSGGRLRPFLFSTNSHHVWLTSRLSQQKSISTKPLPSRFSLGEGFFRVTVRGAESDYHIYPYAWNFFVLDQWTHRPLVSKEHVSVMCVLVVLILHRTRNSTVKLPTICRTISFSLTRGSRSSQCSDCRRNRIQRLPAHPTPLR